MVWYRQNQIKYRYMLAAMKLLDLAGFRVRIGVMRIWIQHFFLIADPDPVHLVFHWCRDEEQAAASGFRSLSLTSVTGKRRREIAFKISLYHSYLNIVNQGRHLFGKKRTSDLDPDVMLGTFCLRIRLQILSNFEEVKSARDPSMSKFLNFFFLLPFLSCLDLDLLTHSLNLDQTDKVFSE